LQQSWSTSFFRKSTAPFAIEIRNSSEIKEFDKSIAVNLFKLTNESIKSKLMGEGVKPGPCILFFSMLKEMEAKFGLIRIAEAIPTWDILKHLKNEISSNDLQFWHRDKRDLSVIK
jgi:hypothetical protein